MIEGIIFASIILVLTLIGSKIAAAITIFYGVLISFLYYRFVSKADRKKRHIIVLILLFLMLSIITTDVIAGDLPGKYTEYEVPITINISASEDALKNTPKAGENGWGGYFEIKNDADMGLSNGFFSIPAQGFKSEATKLHFKHKYYGYLGCKLQLTEGKLVVYQLVKREDSEMMYNNDGSPVPYKDAVFLAIPVKCGTHKYVIKDSLAQNEWIITTLSDEGNFVSGTYRLM